ncbi:MAG: DeoR/GlpR transcriptional regulator, partial [Clostridia bacterium]|nr:DeoR/GlpR transcriptional regulator [Clostridia bacterium]
IRYMEDINIDIAFLTPSGLTAENGFTCGNYSECEFKQLIIKKARKVVLLMDSSKIDKSLPYTFADIGEIDAIITNRDLPPELSRKAQENGTEIIIAKPGI